MQIFFWWLKALIISSLVKSSIQCIDLPFLFLGFANRSLSLLCADLFLVNNSYLSIYSQKQSTIFAHLIEHIIAVSWI